MGIAIAVIVVVVIAVGVGVALGIRRRRAARVPVPAPPPPRPQPAPMTGLDDALAQVTDRSGRSMRDRLDAEGDHVDQLRITDDTGPLLRRALDHVKPTEHDTTEGAPIDPPTGTAATDHPSDDPRTDDPRAGDVDHRDPPSG